MIKLLYFIKAFSKYYRFKIITSYTLSDRVAVPAQQVDFL